MATAIKFPFYIKNDQGNMTYIKMLSPHESIEVMIANDQSAALVYRIKMNDEEFTGAYKDYLNDIVMYSNKEEFDERFHSALRHIQPELIAFQNQLSLN